MCYFFDFNLGILAYVEKRRSNCNEWCRKMWIIRILWRPLWLYKGRKYSSVRLMKDNSRSIVANDHHQYGKKSNQMTMDGNSSMPHNYIRTTIGNPHIISYESNSKLLQKLKQVQILMFQRKMKKKEKGRQRVGWTTWNNSCVLERCNKMHIKPLSRVRSQRKRSAISKKNRPGL